MVRKGKDLFVLLAERQQNSKSRNKDGAASGRKSAARGQKDTSSRAHDVGSTLGRWMQGAVRTMRGDEGATKPAEKPAAKAGSGYRRGRPAPREVPKGLLVPGWLLVGMVVIGIGGGFVVGRVTSGIRADTSLENRGGAALPGRFQPEKPGVDLAPEEAEAVLADFFYICKFHPYSQKSEALALARALRDAGVKNARIRALSGADKSPNWATICYVAANPAPPGVFAELERLAKPLDLDRKTQPKLCVITR